MKRLLSVVCGLLEMNGIIDIYFYPLHWSNQPTRLFRCRLNLIFCRLDLFFNIGNLNNPSLGD